jgi:class 3 adenylate cyclase
MNVAARLCDYCKQADQRLIVSGDLLRQMRVPSDLWISDGETITLRGRQQPVVAHSIRSRRMG